MQRLISIAFLTSAALALPIAAHAADLRPMYKAPVPVAPAFTWSGFYIGVHGGAGWGTKNFDYNDLTPAAPFLWESASPVNGGLAGGQIGFNWQSGWTVFGLEADGSWANIGGHSLCNTTTFFLNCASNTSSIATATAHLGVAVDRAMVYVKGGGAWARDSFTISNVALPPLATGFSSSLSDTRSGWTLGMGAEYAFMPGLSAKIEYDYMDLGTKRYNFPAVTGIGVTNFTNWDIVQHVHVMKVGLNYHFGAGAVSAAY